jgi:hypothetical protein
LRKITANCISWRLTLSLYGFDLIHRTKKENYLNSIKILKFGMEKQ